jgi:hypothetical protein
MRLKSSSRIFTLVLIATLQCPFLAKSQSASLFFYDDVARHLQLNSRLDSLLSFCVRPNYNSNEIFFDSSINQNVTRGRGAKSILTGSTELLLLPLTLQQQYNTHRPYGWNDGSMIPAKGYQSQLSLGVFFKKSIFSIQLRPEVVFAQNLSFSAFPSQQNDTIWSSYYNTVLNVIDAPEKFGSGYYLKIFPGQSSFRINYHKLSLGLSTENLWWGPGIRNSLLMSNNAPGFPHLTLNSLQPVTSPIGSFEWQLISGKLKGSGFLPDTTKMFNNNLLYKSKKKDDRYINGIILTWQPKWTKGLFLGFSRVFYQNLSDVPSSFDGYLPVVGKLFKKRLPSEDEKKRDQMISLFFRLILPKEKAELYGEFGRNDHSMDIRDALAEPEHSRAYIFGFSKIFEGAKKDVQLFTEIANLQLPSTILLRAQESWYVHYQATQGYTNYGQVIGAGIGPGGSSQTMGIQCGEGFNKTGGTIERVVHNNDFYYNAFTNLQQWQKHWVDLSLNLNRSWTHKAIIYDARISFVQSLNYQWYYSNAFNVSARLGITYLF